MLDLVIKSNKEWNELVQRRVCVRGMVCLKPLTVHLIAESENWEQRQQRPRAPDVSTEHGCPGHHLGLGAIPTNCSHPKVRQRVKKCNVLLF